MKKCDTQEYEEVHIIGDSLDQFGPDQNDQDAITEENDPLLDEESEDPEESENLLYEKESKDEFVDSNFYDNYNSPDAESNIMDNQQRISFVAETSYRNNYLGDIYDTEEFYFINFIKEKFIFYLKEFISTHEQYAFLKSCDMSLISEDDVVLYQKEKENYTVNYIFSNNEVLISKSPRLVDMKIVDMKELAPLDKFLSKLRGQDYELLYNYLSERVNGKDNTDVEFFFVFSNYFKIGEGKLYQMIPHKFQERLKNTLKKRL